MDYFRNLFRYKDLFLQLTLREIKAKYKQSILGYSWVILVPLINLGVLSIVFSYLFKVPTGNIPYPIFLFVALVPWLFLSNAVSSATGSVIANGSLVTKVSLPREILPASAVTSKLVDLFLMMIILSFFLILYKISFHPTLLFAPVIVLSQILLIMGVSFFLSAGNVFYRDIEHAVGLLLMVWMYLTPIVYSPDLIPKDLKSLFYLNPMAGIIDAYRNIILDGNLPDWGSFCYSAAISLAVFVLGYLYFKNRSRFFADVI